MPAESPLARLFQGAIGDWKPQFPAPPDEDEWEKAQRAADQGMKAGGVTTPAPMPGVPQGQMAPQPKLPGLDEEYKQVALGNAMGAIRPVATAGGRPTQALGMDPLSAYMATQAQQKIGRAKQDLDINQKQVEDYNKYALLRADITKRYAEQLAARDAEIKNNWAKMKDETARRGQDTQIEVAKIRGSMAGRLFGLRADLSERNKLLDQIQGGKALSHMGEIEGIADTAEAFIKANPSPFRSAVAGFSPKLGAKIDEYAPASAEWMRNVDLPFGQYTDQALTAINNARITMQQVALTKEKDFPRYGLPDEENLRRISTLRAKMAETQSFVQHLMEAATALGAKHSGAGLGPPKPPKPPVKPVNMNE